MAGLRILGCILLLAATPIAQCYPAGSRPCAPPAWNRAEIRAHLASEAPEEVAWAAYLVRHQRLRELVPVMRQALARLDGSYDPPHRLACMQILDALVELGVRLPGEELLPHAQGGVLVPALILAARSPHQNTVFFEERFADLMHVPDLEWQACGNLLAAQKAPGFAARCLREAELTLEVAVVDGAEPADPPAPEPARPGALTLPQVPDGFPPVSHYSLVSCPAGMPIENLVADGPVRVGYHRMPDRYFYSVWRDPQPVIPRNKRYVQWIGQLLGAPDTVPLPLRTMITVRWEKDAAFLGEVAAAREGIDRQFRATVVRLAAAGALTTEERAAAEPNLRLHVHDERRHAAEALPDVTAPR